MKIYTKIYTLAVAAVVLALASPVQAQDWYASGGIGASLTPDLNYSESSAGFDLKGDLRTSNATNFSLAAGKEITENTRAELELSHRKTKLKSIDYNRLTVGGTNFVPGRLSLGGNIKTTAILVNGYYDFNAGQALRPYVSAGLGLVRHNATLNNIAGIAVPATSSRDTVFAYQLGTGVSLGMSENTDLVAGYRYLGTADAKTVGVKWGYEAHEINVGVRYGF